MLVRAMLVTVSVVALVALVTLPASAQDYVGTWSSNPAQCRNGQEVEDAPLIMKRNRYDQHEAHCTFVAVTKHAAYWSVRSRCVVEGTNVTNNFTIQVDADTLIMTGEDKGQTQLQRCR